MSLLSLGYCRIGASSLSSHGSRHRPLSVIRIALKTATTLSAATSDAPLGIGRILAENVPGMFLLV
jgi:hypothetical protein